MELRFARADDAGAIRDIYAPYVENTTVSFEYKAPTREETAERISGTLAAYPYLVCGDEGIIAGYAYAGRYRSRKAFDWCAELSVYVHEAFARRGIASALYGALVELLKLQGVRRVYAAISIPNDKSVALHEACGFQFLYSMKKIGYKLGRWCDLAMYETELLPAEGEPGPFIPVGELDPEAVTAVLRGYAEKIR